MTTEQHEPTPEQVAVVASALMRGIVQRAYLMSADDVELVVFEARALVERARAEERAILPVYERALSIAEAYRAFRLELERLRPKE